MHTICREICQLTLTNTRVLSNEYHFKGEHINMPYVNNFIEEVKHVLSISMDRRSWTLLKYNNQLYIGAVCLVHFVKYDGEPNMLGMIKFIMEYAPRELFARCTPKTFDFYINYIKSLG